MTERRDPPAGDPPAGDPPTNHLAGSTSPYLLQHVRNPVDWYPWGREALERSRQEAKPIFLSIGYAACHWCHVMAHESFEDPATAAILNRDFVSIKVDREERPDLDEVYMAAVQAMTGSGGWPMSVFLTPDLEPFYGGTYFPPDDRHGLPAFSRLLEAIAEAWRTRRGEIATQGRQLAAHLRDRLDVPAGSADPQLGQLERAAARLTRAFDPVHAGFGGAPKFPPPMPLEFLLRAWRRSGSAELLAVVTRTLDAMAAGGIRDQLGGGFARYSTDAAWLVPHFEKMLYDNALLAHAYLEAWRATGEPRYRSVAESTLDFMLAELLTSDGGFASALDADSEGVEGRFYTWTEAEFVATLEGAGLATADIAAVAAHWGVTIPGNWEGRNVLHATGHDAEPRLVSRARTALLAARSRRPRPARDDKQLAAWNGLALRALAGAALAFGRDDYLHAVEAHTTWLRGALLRDGDRLWRASRDGTVATPGFLEDYACVADGLLAAHAALGRPADLELAAGLVARAIDDFWDAGSGTFWDTSVEHDALVARPRSLIDAATPSGNAVAADVLLRLALLTGEPDHDRRARSILRAAAGALEGQPSAFGRMLCAADRALSEPVDAVVAGEPGDPAALALRRAAARPYAPDLVLAGCVPSAMPPGWALFEGKVPRADSATAYVCRGYACEAPTSDVVVVGRQVAALASPRPDPVSRGGS
jgi:uncharacterized protein YyaL (SSP411 family)